MARVLGAAGRYVSQEAGRKQQRMLLVGFAASGVTLWISGFLIGFGFYRKPWWVNLLIGGIAIAAMLMLWWWASRQISKLGKGRDELRRGAAGELSVGLRLADFPKGFYIINDLTTRFGNLDHVVIGPTGVFALDTKNWRGTVSADGKGELLLEGRSTDKPYVKQFVRRVMGIKERLKSLAPDDDPFIQAVFVFASARVNAKWGTTGNVHCIRDEQLYEYVVESKRGRKLDNRQAKRIAQAFAALARMDADFTDAARATRPEPEALKSS